MNYVFFGSPEFAAILLKRLIEAGMPPQAVVANPDRPVGRKQIMTVPPVKRLIANGIEHMANTRIEILQPDKPITMSRMLLAMKPDFFVVAAYSKIIPKEILALPRRGTIGVHPSLLPKYRGATPIQSALLGGEKVTGVTLYLIDEKVDHGPILKNEEYRMENGETYESLLKKLATVAGDLLVETIPKFVAGKITPQVQDESQATYTKKFTTDDAFVSAADLQAALADDREKAINIDRKIRALGHEPGVWTLHDGKRKKLLAAEIVDDRLRLKKIQVEGKVPISL